MQKGTSDRRDPPATRSAQLARSCDPTDHGPLARRNGPRPSSRWAADRFPPLAEASLVLLLVETPVLGFYDGLKPIRDIEMLPKNGQGFLCQSRGLLVA